MNAECISCDCFHLKGIDIQQTCLDNQDNCLNDEYCLKYKFGDYTIEIK